MHAFGVRFGVRFRGDGGGDSGWAVAAAAAVVVVVLMMTTTMMMLMMTLPRAPPLPKRLEEPASPLPSLPLPLADFFRPIPNRLAIVHGVSRVLIKYYCHGLVFSRKNMTTAESGQWTNGQVWRGAPACYCDGGVAHVGDSTSRPVGCCAVYKVSARPDGATVRAFGPFPSSRSGSLAAGLVAWSGVRKDSPLHKYAYFRPALIFTAIQRIRSPFNVETPTEFPVELPRPFVPGSLRLLLYRLTDRPAPRA